MEVQAYLARIGYSGSMRRDISSLQALVRAHLHSIPFENFDIHMRVPIVLEEQHLFDKIIHRRRGGFCYELNTLFAALLRALGYRVEFVSGRVWRQGRYGPAMDHMALSVWVSDTAYLVDVGFGEASFGPLRLAAGVSHQARGQRYALQRMDRSQLLFTFENVRGIRKRYALNPMSCRLEDFSAMCLHHQRSAQSWFTRERICILLTDKGPRRLMDGSLQLEGESPQQIEDPNQILKVLKSEFGIHLPGYPDNTSAGTIVSIAKRAMALKDWCFSQKNQVADFIHDSVTTPF